MSLQNEAGTYYNSVTQRHQDEYNISVATIDSSTGKGNMMLWNEQQMEQVQKEGEQVLRRLYDFNATPGARRVVRSFMLQRYAYVDHVYGCAGVGKATALPIPAFTPIFSSKWAERC